MSVLTQFTAAVAGGAAAPTLRLTLAAAAAAPPPGVSLDDLAWLDLPVAGRVAVGQSGLASGVVAGLPFVGEVDLVHPTMDPSNVVMLETQGGLFIRGEVGVA